MRIRVALHVHSRLSHDGTLTIAELAQWYRDHGFHVVGMGEHSQDMSEQSVRQLVDDCAANSDAGFLMLPGIEFTCGSGMHILGAGCIALTPEREPAPVARHIRENGGFAVLAHPKRFGWNCAPEILQAIEAVEIWNIGYDGRYLPSRLGPTSYRAMRQVNPELLAIASHDLHRKVGFYDMALEMDVDRLERDAVLGTLRAGRYKIRSRLFNTDAQARLSALQSLLFRMGRMQLEWVRDARDIVVRWSQ